MVRCQMGPAATYVHYKRPGASPSARFRPRGHCQHGLEGGDGIEGLPRQTFRITMPNGLTYHPQNEALLQWFAFASPSSELDGAYSHPDITTLTALSARQMAGGAPRNFEPSPRTKEQGADRERAPFCFACIVVPLASCMAARESEARSRVYDLLHCAECRDLHDNRCGAGVLARRQRKVAL